MTHSHLIEPLLELMALRLHAIICLGGIGLKVSYVLEDTTVIVVDHNVVHSRRLMVAWRHLLLLGLTCLLLSLLWLAVHRLPRNLLPIIAERKRCSEFLFTLPR